MGYLLTKLLPLTVYPLSLAILLCLLGLLLLRTNRKRRAALSLILSIAILWGASTSIVADSLVHSLEKHYPPVSVKAMPTAGAIVVLGGMTRGMVPGTGLTDLDGGIDRLIHGTRLFNARKAPLMILTGGNAEGFQPESEAMADIVQLMGVPAEAIVLESTSRNTYQNGLYTVPILKERGIHQILLVTSASHMRRASAVFERMGISVIPAATDYQIVERYKSILDWLPQASALNTTTRGIKEYIGWWFYSLRSKI